LEPSVLPVLLELGELLLPYELVPVPDDELIPVLLVSDEL
jgi:hypothetical protein